jgi:hypothetical protein
MILTSSNQLYIQYSASMIICVHLLLYVYEIRSLKSVIFRKETLNLLGFLFSLTMMSITRVLGVMTSNILIRTYLTGIFGLVAMFFFVTWGNLIVHFDRKFNLLSVLFLLIGMTGFFYSRLDHSTIIEIISLLSLISVMLIIMGQIFSYIFKTSPYVRARQRLFLLSLSFFLHCIFEFFIVTLMGSDLYLQASLVILLTTLTRVGMTTSIILPLRITDVLSKFIR